MRILVTGGAGYIGSHTCLELLRSHHEIYVIDNLINGSTQALKQVKRLANHSLSFKKCDIRDRKKLSSVFADFEPEAVIHFAGLKSVSESFTNSAEYHEVNVGGTAVLLNEMEHFEVQKIVFSSSATVYGVPNYLPCDEQHPLNPITPYGRTKLIGEQLLRDWSSVDKYRQAVALRYFNPVGADPSGWIGEDPKGDPNNLLPFIAQVASGKRNFLRIFGDDYNTIDGTGVRDYIHVSDLARAHVDSVKCLEKFLGFEAINIGTGKGVSVLQMLREFERQSGVSINFEVAPRRDGDAAEVWADASYAAEKINFQTKYSLSDICRDAWLWQSLNPQGYAEGDKI